MNTNPTVQFVNKIQSSLMGDIFYSPLSIQLALGMCRLGAKNETETCLNDLICYEEDAFSNLIKEINKKIKTLNFLFQTVYF